MVRWCPDCGLTIRDCICVSRVTLYDHTLAGGLCGGLDSRLQAAGVLPISDRDCGYHSVCRGQIHGERQA